MVKKKKKKKSEKVRSKNAFFKVFLLHVLTEQGIGKENTIYFNLFKPILALPTRRNRVYTNLKFFEKIRNHLKRNEISWGKDGTLSLKPEIQ